MAKCPHAPDEEEAPRAAAALRCVVMCGASCAPDKETAEKRKGEPRSKRRRASERLFIADVHNPGKERLRFHKQLEHEDLVAPLRKPI